MTAPDMLRVLVLSTLFPDATRPTFGVFVEKQTLALAARSNVAVHVVAPIGAPAWPLSLHPRYRGFSAVPYREDWKGLTVERPRFPVIPKIGQARRPAAMARALIPLLEDMRGQFPFDAIAAQFFYPDGPAAIALGRHFGVPVSIKARGADIHLWGRKFATRRPVREAGRAAEGLLAVSGAMKADMIALGMPAERITVHYTGIDRSLFAPTNRQKAKAEWDVAGPLIVTAGALIPRKGQLLVVEAMRELPDATLFLVGEGEHRGAIERRIAVLGLEGRVRLLGRQPHDAVARLLAAADVMALPSESEGLANVWVEALACGTPVVISDCGGARELVDRPEAGAIVPREPGAIAKAIAAILADPPSEAAVRETVAEFSWERNGEALEAQLRQLVGEN
ncbi:MAG: glycosyltransferase [Parasphingopyxis sp.]|uniref:glycosyltransferase n=1 Tax=Parasphingopyxis sp. TaxID=1920299 RepID=UPI0032EE5E94